MVSAEPGEPRVRPTRGEQPDGKMGALLGRWLRAQALIAILLGLALLPLDRVAAYSSILGSLAAWIPAVFFAAIVGRQIGSDSGAFLRSAVIGESVKLLLTAIVCAAVFIWVDPLMAGWFFAGMIVVMIAGWVGMFRVLGIQA